MELPVPFEAQTRPDFCGIAVASMLADYYGRPFSAAQRENLGHAAEAGDGLSGADLKRALEQQGLFAAVFPGRLDDSEAGLYRHLNLRRPLIVMLGDGPRHYAVLCGFDRSRATLTLVDPARGRIRVSDDDFKRAWAQANEFTLLASPTR